VNVLHDRLASSMMLFTLAAAAWGLAAFVRRRQMDGTFWGILAVGGIVFVAQAVLGVLLLLDGARPLRPIHFLFGAVAALTLPLYYAVSKGRDDRTATLIYAVLCLFLAGVILGSTITGA
jgi:hypothetical protein